ncbi:MAG: protein O-mannosyl-transferase, partial [Blastocatellia bacterium]|nr:protein O-mannosyl-transferase [Blastocatellia bacterium]
LGRKRWWFAASLASFGLAILAKETALILPAVIFFHAYIFGDGENSGAVNRLRKAIGVALAYLPLTILYFIVRYLALKGLSHTLTPLTWKTKILTWPSLLFFYLKSLIWPIGLSAFYDTPYVTTVGFRSFILPLLAILCAGVVLYLWARRSRLAAFFSIWMILPVLPLLNISIFKEGEIAHDRYLYLPSVGLCVLVVLALSYLGANKMAMPVALLLILAAFFGIATFSQSAMWASDFSLAARGVEVAPNNAMAANNLGKELALRGDYNGAVPLFRKAVERRPRYWLANFNLGYVYYRVGNLPEAVIYLRRAIEIFPRDAAEQRFLGYTLLEMGRNSEAESTLRQAIALKSDAPNQHFALGTILRDRKDLEGALREFRLELTFNPGNQQARQAISDLEAQRASER